ncbi:MAG: twin-arginine translocase subunit TatC [Fimbriimonadaceae bacterium]|nr:twin-arginine translocase subunit TatC [Fimbriimonadaceae bacterium]
MPVKLKRNQRRNSSGDPEEFRMSLGDHFEEIRSRIVRVVIVITVLWIIGWYLEKPLYDLLNNVIGDVVEIYKKTHPDFVYAEPFSTMTAPFMLKFKLSFMIAIGIALPYLILEIWGFVSPGLREKEQKPIKRLAPISVFLFFLGAFFCWLILPQTFAWFLSYLEEFPGTSLFQEPGTMVFFTLKLILAFGIGFQLPLVVYLAAKIGLVTPETLQHYWRHGAVFVFFASAILTPSNDAFTMLMMAVPLTILLMLSIFFVKLTMRDKGEGDPELNDLD